MRISKKDEEINLTEEMFKGQWAEQKKLYWEFNNSDI